MGRVYRARIADMNVPRIGAAALLATASLRLAGPGAPADTGIADPIFGASGSAGQLDPGGIIESLPGEPATADCDPPGIPVQ
jgi:hypothetical protein